jgi:signal transduction histidine kinase
MAENAILDARTLRLEANVQRTTWITGLAGLLATISAMLGVISLGRYRAQMRLLQLEQGHRRHLEGRVEERTAELSEVNRELDAFAYTISHDLRAPLRAMYGYADALEEDYGEGLPQDGQQFIRRIKAAAWRMENLIEDILTYSRLARSEVSLRPTSMEAAVDGASPPGHADAGDREPCLKCSEVRGARHTAGHQHWR